MIESATAVGVTSGGSASWRYLPVRTRIPGRPAAIAPPTSASTSSPTITALSSPMSTIAA